MKQSVKKSSVNQKDNTNKNRQPQIIAVTSGKGAQMMMLHFGEPKIPKILKIKGKPLRNPIYFAKP